MMWSGSAFVGGVRRWIESLTSHADRSPRLTVVRTDELPAKPSARHLYLVGERGEDWYAAMRCPYRRGAVIELNLVPPGRPCWRLTTEPDGSPSLSPSVWRE